MSNTLENIINTVTANGMREITVDRAKQIAVEYAEACSKVSLELTNDEKCVYCPEYGNQPCKKCDEKAKAMEQPKKYIKVKVSERLPSVPFEEVRIITDLDEWGTGYASEKGNWWLHQKLDGKVRYFLEEVPDRESELIEMLERVLRLKPLIQYPDDVQLEFEDEAIAVNNLIRDIESLINKK